MRSLIIFLICQLFFPAWLFSQKKLIDTSVYDNWPTLGKNIISNNGKYVLYQYGSVKGGYILVLQQADGKRKKNVLYSGSSIKDFAFSDDSKHAIAAWAHDSLLVFNIGSERASYFTNVSSFKVFQSGKKHLLACLQPEGLRLMDLNTAKEEVMMGVTAYWVNKQGDAAVVKTKEALNWIDLVTKETTVLFQGNNVSGGTFDASGTQFAFMVAKKAEQPGCVIMSYKKGMNQAIVRAADTSMGTDTGWVVSNRLRPFFNKRGDKLFFYLEKKSLPQKTNKKVDAATVDIWNYQDEALQSEQLLNLTSGATEIYLAVSNDDKHGLLRLREEDDELLLQYDVGDYILAMKKRFKTDWWNKGFSQSIYLVSTKDGSRKKIVEKSRNSLDPKLSSGSRFVIWFNETTKQYCSYEISTGSIHYNITKGITVPVYNDEADFITARTSFGIAGWLANDSAMLIYDRYDIWMVDPLGISMPVNVTNGYGRLHKVVFRCPLGDWLGRSSISPQETLLVSAFSLLTKENGFYKIKLKNAPIDPEKSTMGPYVYTTSSKVNPGITGLVNEISPPIKASYADNFLVQRMSATEALNLFITKDFKSFTRVTDLQPQKKYNWLTSELINWKMLDGRISQGILYKPENFDPLKKYPLIFYYYEQLSSELNKFWKPGWSRETIDIPTYVSNGYLVFMPDIHSALGYPGDAVVNSVVSAAKYLCTLPFVDSTKLGLQGHSHGGFETNYLITHSNIFAAACEAAGQSDFISAYGQLKGHNFLGSNRFFSFELFQSNIGAPLWDKPELYIRNSPIFLANKVTTPLLIMHNKNDNAVPFEQAIEMFLNLRRAGKKVWLLQYDDEGHALTNDPNNAKDFTIRMRQFFDHYLKGAPPPKWMTEGVPARLKGIEDGLELDTSGKQP